MLENKDLKKNPFTVPEGYFSRLQKDIMGKLPEQSPKVVRLTPRHSFLRPVIGIAASVFVAVSCISVYLHKSSISSSAPSVKAPTHVQIATLPDDAADYIMIDNEDIYNYMMEL